MTAKAQRMVKLVAGNQSRECTWSVMCWEHVGGKNVDIISRIDKELAEHGMSAFYLGPNRIECIVTPIGKWEAMP